MVKNLPANAGGHGFSPWSRKIPCVSEQLSLSATAPEPTCPELMLCNKRSHHNEKPTHHITSTTSGSSLSVTRDSNEDPVQ